MSGFNQDGMQGIDPQQLMQMLAMQRRDPFSRNLPGMGLLGDGGMSMGPQQGMDQSMPPMGQQADTQLNQMPGQPDLATNNDVAPGLPNLPQNFGGFGYGQFAPKSVQPMGIKQQLIAHLMQQLGGGM